MRRPVLSYATALLPSRLFEYAGPVELALSGGRSSAVLLLMMLQQFGGRLPDNWHVLFANTGREHPATLAFVRDIQEFWNINVHWIELEAIGPERRVIAKKVDFASAARKGEPFKILLESDVKTPSFGVRTCTEYMKVHTSEAYMQQALGIAPKWTKLLGYREDEKHRLEKALFRCGRKPTNSIPDAPLAHAGINKSAVLEIMAAQPFDLMLPPHLGNCIFCFLKGEATLHKAAQAMPAELAEWIGMDALIAPYTLRQQGGYAGLRERVLAGLAPKDAEDFLDLECGCTD